MAQIVAGNHPRMVTCSNRQMMPDIGRPIVKNVSQGKINEISKRILPIL